MIGLSLFCEMTIMTKNGALDISRWLLMIGIFVLAILPTSKLDAQFLKNDVNRNIRDCKDPEIYFTAGLHVSSNKINVDVIYNEIYFPNQTFDLVLFKGDNTLDCRRLCGAKLAGFKRRTLPVDSSLYENLDPGHYCARLSYKLSKSTVGRCPIYNTNTVQIAEIEGPENLVGSTVIENQPNNRIYVALAICFTLIGLIAITVAIIVFKVVKPNKGQTSDQIAAPCITTHPCLASRGLINEGDDLTFVCQAQGVQPISYTWYKNGNPIRAGARMCNNGGQGEMSVLEIYNFQPENDDPRFTVQCLVKNRGGETLSNQFNFQFTRRPLAI